MRCPNCGQELAEDVKFCRRCGTPVAAGNQSGPSEASDSLTAGKETGRKKKGHPVLLVFLILVLLAAGAGGAVLGVKIWKAQKEDSQTRTASHSGDKKNSKKSDKEDSEEEEDTPKDDSDKEREEETKDDTGRGEPASDRAEKGDRPASDSSEKVDKSAAGSPGESAKGREQVTDTSKEGRAVSKESTATGESTAAGAAAGGEDPKGGTAAESAPIESLESAPPVTMDHVELVMASSSLSEYDMTHSPERLCDGELSSAWVEGAEGQGIGESVTFCFDETCVVTGFLIHGGYQKSRDLYQKNSRPARLRVFIPGYEEAIYLLGDEFGVQDIPLEVPVETKEITFIIEDVYAGSKYEDTVISELTFY